MLRNLTDYIIIPFLAFRMLRNLTDYVTMLPFDFRHVTELHRSCNKALFWLLARYGTSRIVQQWVPSTSKRSSKGCMPSNNGPRTKLGYDTRSSNLAQASEEDLILMWAFLTGRQIDWLTWLGTECTRHYGQMHLFRILNWSPFFSVIFKFLLTMNVLFKSRDLLL